MTPPLTERTMTEQAAAVQQFRVWAADPDVLVVDTETTALDGVVWELAAVRVHHPAPVLAFMCAPPPGVMWSERAAEMHAGRLDEITRAAVPDVFSRPLGLLEVQPVVTYGAGFDYSAIQRTWPGFNRSRTFGCVMTAYAPLAGRWSESKGAWKFVSLVEACQLERIDTRGLELEAHTAYGDALMTAALIRAVAARETDAEREHREWIDHAEQMATERGEALP